MTLIIHFFQVMKDRFKSKFKKEEVNLNPYWNKECRRACEEADAYIKKLQI